MVATCLVDCALPIGLALIDQPTVKIQSVQDLIGQAHAIDDQQSTRIDTSIRLRPLRLIVTAAIQVRGINDQLFDDP